MSIEELAAPEIREAAPYRRRGRGERSPTAGFFRGSRKPSPRSTTRSNISAFTKRRTWSTTSSGATSATGTSSGSSRRLADADRERCRAGVAQSLCHVRGRAAPAASVHALPHRGAVAPAAAARRDARSIALEPFPRPARIVARSRCGSGRRAAAGADRGGAQYSRRAEARSEAARGRGLSSRRRRKFAKCWSKIAIWCCASAMLSDLRFSEAELDPTAGPVRVTPQFDLRIAYGQTRRRRRGTCPAAQGERTPGARHWIRSRAGWPTRPFAAGRRRRSSGSWKPHSPSAESSSTRSRNAWRNWKSERTLRQAARLF